MNLDHSRILAARLFATGLLLASTGSALAEVHYVDVNSTNAALPYTNWAAAAPSQNSLHYHYFKERRSLKLETEWVAILQALTAAAEGLRPALSKFGLAPEKTHVLPDSRRVCPRVTSLQWSPSC